MRFLRSTPDEILAEHTDSKAGGTPSTVKVTTDELWPASLVALTCSSCEPGIVTEVFDTNGRPSRIYRLSGARHRQQSRQGRGSAHKHDLVFWRTRLLIPYEL